MDYRNFTMDKTIRIKVDDILTNIHVQIQIKNNKQVLSITGNMLGSWGGQIYDYIDPLINPKLIIESTCKNEWDLVKHNLLLKIWREYHLNDLHSECPHQRLLGWTYKEHSKKVSPFKGNNCPICGYSIGSKWLYEELPDYVIDALIWITNNY